MGGFPSESSHSTLGSPKCALIRYSFPPCWENTNKLWALYPSTLSDQQIPWNSSICWSQLHEKLNVKTTLMTTAKSCPKTTSFLHYHYTNRERLDGPHNAVLFWGVFYWSYWSLEFRGVCIIGDWNYDLHIVGCWPPLKLGLGLDHVLHSAVCMPFNHWFYPDQWLYLRIIFHISIFITVVLLLFVAMSHNKKIKTSTSKKYKSVWREILSAVKS